MDVAEANTLIWIDLVRQSDKEKWSNKRSHMNFSRYVCYVTIFS